MTLRLLPAETQAVLAATSHWLVPANSFSSLGNASVSVLGIWRKNQHKLLLKQCTRRITALAATLKDGQSTAEADADVVLPAGEPNDSSTSASAYRQQLFSRISPMYDQLNDWLSLGQHRVWKRMAVKWSGAKAGDTVLDVCCGSGDLSLLLAQVVGPSGKVVGLDFSEDMLTVAAERQSTSFSASRMDIRWMEGDALSLPFTSEEFDAVTISYGLRNVTDIPRCLREVCRVLRPGACLSVLDFNNATDPGMSSFQGWMLDNVIVPVARQFDMEEEYRYLGPSIRGFPTGPEQIRLAKDAGFSRATHYELAGGHMGVLVATK